MGEIAISILAAHRLQLHIQGGAHDTRLTATQIDNRFKGCSQTRSLLAACAQSVQDTIPACTALRQMAAANSPLAARLASVVGDICKDCETECCEHEEKHSVCYDCAEACAQCAKECQNAANP
jgi:Cys-rich four helix bundle protein (predicted Tat secretion target)